MRRFWEFYVEALPLELLGNYAEAEKLYEEI
jgi:hypothetical protein